MTTSQAHIKVVMGQDQQTVTLLPNEKTPDVQLYLVGTSTGSPLSSEERKTPLRSVTLQLNKKKRCDELIVLETQVSGKWSAHLIELIWKERGPYIDLGRQWVPRLGCPLMQNWVCEDRLCLRVAVGTGAKQINYSTKELSEGHLLTPPDLICKVVVGKISPAVFRREVLKANGITPAIEKKAQQPEPTQSVAHEVETQKDDEITQLNAKIQSLTQETEKLADELKKALFAIEQNQTPAERDASELGGLIYKVWTMANHKGFSITSPSSQIKALLNLYLGSNDERPYHGSRTMVRYLQEKNYIHLPQPPASLHRKKS